MAEGNMQALDLKDRHALTPAVQGMSICNGILPPGTLSDPEHLFAKSIGGNHLQTSARCPTVLLLQSHHL